MQSCNTASLFILNWLVVVKKKKKDLGFGSGSGSKFNCAARVGLGRVGSDDLGYGPGSGFSLKPVQTSNSESAPACPSGLLDLALPTLPLVFASVPESSNSVPVPEFNPPRKAESASTFHCLSLTSEGWEGGGQLSPGVLEDPTLVVPCPVVLEHPTLVVKSPLFI